MRWSASDKVANWIKSDVLFNIGNDTQTRRTPLDLSLNLSGVDQVLIELSC